MVECAAGKPAAEPWHSLVNPGVPVDAETAKLHKLDDARLGRAPVFARIADTVASLLTPRDGEMVVVVGHNIGYDLAVLRAEMRRVGREFPDLPTLDTIGALAAHVGLKASRNLLDICADLGVVGPHPWHAADHDAMAAARAVCVMLDRAADAGDFDMATLLARCGSTALAVTPGRRIGQRSKATARATRAIPPAHATRHPTLPPKPAPRTLAR
jgi:DNA polymerase III epsilon subunit-like protein